MDLMCGNKKALREIAALKSYASASHPDFWLSHRDSNPDKVNQNHLCYRYTMGQSRFLGSNIANHGQHARFEEKKSIVMDIEWKMYDIVIMQFVK